MISVVIQGGAMRSIYCLGAIRALVEAGYAGQVGTIHTASAGCVSGAVLAGHIADPKRPSVTETAHAMLDRLAGPRFINLRRPRRVVDVDYLVDTIKETTGLSPTTLADRVVFEVGLTDARDGSARYIDVSRSSSEDELYQALRGTMAIPLLYPKKVVIDGRRYIDGGISDPLPVLRALHRNPTILVAISSVARTNLGRELEGRESSFVRYLPGLSPTVRRMLLVRNPLAAATESLTELPSVGGITFVRIAPLDQSQLGHRLETNRDRLLVLEEMGYQDGVRALRKLDEPKPGAGAPNLTEASLRA